MAKDLRIRDEQGNLLYPVTVTDLVFDDQTGKTVKEQLAEKQDTISDLSTIRSGASAGSTAYQKPSGGIPKTDLASAVQTSLGKADTALQSHQDISGKQDVLVSGTNIKTVNNTSLLGSGNISIPKGDPGEDGEDAYQPFKGWFDSSSALSAAYPSPQVGDFAYVRGATSTDPVAIYACSTAGTWADSGNTFNPANNQEFASGEALNTVHIVDGLESSSATDVLSAKQGKVLDQKVAALGPKIGKINEQINGVVLNEKITTGTGYVYSNPKSSWFSLKQGVEYTLHFTSASPIQNPIYFLLMTEEGNEDSYVREASSMGMPTGNTTYTKTFTATQDYPNVFVGTGGTTSTELQAEISFEGGIANDVDKLQTEVEGSKTSPTLKSFANGWIGYSDHILHGSALFQQVVGFPCADSTKILASIFNPGDDAPAVISFFSKDYSDAETLDNSTLPNYWVSGVQRNGAGRQKYEVLVPAGAVYCFITSRNEVATDIYKLSGFVKKEQILNLTTKDYVDGKDAETNANLTALSTKVNSYDKMLTSEPLKSQYFDDSGLVNDQDAVHLLFTDSSNLTYRNKDIIGLRVMCTAASTLKIVKGTGVHSGDTEWNITELQTYNVVAGENILYLDTPVRIKNEDDFIGLQCAKAAVKRVYSSSNVCFYYFHPTYNDVRASSIDQVCAVICSNVSMPQEGEVSVETRMEAAEKSIVGINKMMPMSLYNFPLYYHWNPNSFVNGIPSQSVEDNILAARLGFKWVEANTQATATDGKFIVTHGNAGKFGQEFSSTYENVAINSMSYADIMENVKYNSPQACYNHAVSSLDSFCASCAQLGLGVFLRTGQQALVETARKYLRDDMIILPGDTSNPRKTLNFGGFLYTYFSGNGDSTICNLTYLLNYAEARGGAPYHFVMNGTAIEYMITQGTLDSIVQGLKEKGIVLGCCYATSQTIDKLMAAGGVGHAAQEGQCNLFQDGNVGTWSPLDADLSGWEIASGATISGGRIVNGGSSNIVVKTPSTGVIPLGKGQLEARISGSVTFNFGVNGNISYTDYDLEKPIVIARAGFNKDMQLTITIGTNSSVEFLNYRVSRC